MERYTKYFLPILSFVISLCIFYFVLKSGVKYRELFAVAVVIIGYLFWFIGRVNLSTSYSLLPKTKKLITNGLYSKIRHPLYYSQLVVLAGMYILLNVRYVWLFFFSIVLLQYYRLKKEEKVLENYFGRDYLEWKDRTWF